MCSVTRLLTDRRILSLCAIYILPTFTAAMSVASGSIFFINGLSVDPVFCFSPSSAFECRRANPPQVMEKMRGTAIKRCMVGRNIRLI